MNTTYEVRILMTVKHDVNAEPSLTTVLSAIHSGSIEKLESELEVYLYMPVRLSVAGLLKT